MSFESMSLGAVLSSHDRFVTTTNLNFVFYSPLKLETSQSISWWRLEISPKSRVENLRVTESYKMENMVRISVLKNSALALANEKYS